MRVYEKVPRSQASRDGCKVITTRWLDVNKGDDVKPECRSRMVAMEFKKVYSMEGLEPLTFSSTPYETLKLLIQTLRAFRHPNIGCLEDWVVGFFSWTNLIAILTRQLPKKHLLNEVLEVKIHQNLIKESQRRSKKGKRIPKSVHKEAQGSQAAPKRSKIGPKSIRNRSPKE